MNMSATFSAATPGRGCESLLLISGAFAAFRREAVVAVGGFDPECWVEDYELIHRLHRYAAENGLTWRVRILGDAVASTDAPAAPPPVPAPTSPLVRRLPPDPVVEPRHDGRAALRRARPRHDAGQGDRHAAADLWPDRVCAAHRLSWSRAAAATFAPALGLMIAKVGLDVANMALLLAAYRRWTGGRAAPSFSRAIVCLALEPFTFQILRHLGAAWGWVAALSGAAVWERPAPRSDPLAGGAERLAGPLRLRRAARYIAEAHFARVHLGASAKRLSFSAKPQAPMAELEPRRAPAHLRDHLAPGRGQDHADREDPAVRRRHPARRRSARQGQPPPDPLRLDGHRARARHLGRHLGDDLRIRRTASSTCSTRPATRTFPRTPTAR